MGTPSVKYLIKRKQQLVEERASWEVNWKDAQSYILPISGRFIQDKSSDRNYNKIIDNTGTMASRVLASGLMSGLTSPARPWFKLVHPNTELAAMKHIKAWSEEVTRRMRYIFQKSNLYQVLPSMYRELSVYGTAAMVPVPDQDTVVRFRQFTVGEYYISAGAKRTIDTIYRQYNRTVKQLVEEFGYENVSVRTKSMYDRQQFEQPITVNHLIEPNLDRKFEINNNRNMAYRSVYWEDTSGDDAIVKVSGFEDFKVLVPRWDLMVGDNYGFGPAIEALGDIKQLQHQQRFKGLAIEKMVNPPMVADAAMRGDIISNAPSSVTYMPSTNNPNAQGIRDAYQVRIDINHLMMDIQEVQNRIDTAFYKDLFLMITNDNGAGRATATEIAEKHQEKLLMLGPVLQRFNDELLKPIVSLTFEEMVKREFIPEVPQELQGQELSVEFISLLAQAQEIVGIGSIERLVGFAGNLAQFKPEVLDKLNADEALEEYANMLGSPSSIIRTEEEVGQVRAERAKQQQMQQMMEAAPAMAQGAQAAKTLSETDLAGLAEQVNGGVA